MNDHLNNLFDALGSPEVLDQLKRENTTRRDLLASIENEKQKQVSIQQQVRDDLNKLATQRLEFKELKQETELLIAKANQEQEVIKQAHKAIHDKELEHKKREQDLKYLAQIVDAKKLELDTLIAELKKALG